MDTKQLGFSLSIVPSKSKYSSLVATALWMQSTCWATTDSTSSSMRLNSSKHAHAPDEARPLKNYEEFHQRIQLHDVLQLILELLIVALQTLQRAQGHNSLVVL
ncbi:hypothetical protein EYF80_049919 [Liparis tanakae]|uniref:Uncharacterized protein n=1 Tax=Liparis tanakae TaxID=230148 RepID=A0A4Z2FGA3_9TELE|nr:hypothetical protein EYF80_049919 [Liparis tanakae]